MVLFYRIPHMKIYLFYWKYSFFDTHLIHNQILIFHHWSPKTKCQSRHHHFNNGYVIFPQSQRIYFPRSSHQFIVKKTKTSIQFLIHHQLLILLLQHLFLAMMYLKSFVHARYQQSNFIIWEEKVLLKTVMNFFPIFLYAYNQKWFVIL